MNILKSLFRFYIQSSIHVALAICALAGITVLTYGTEWDWPVFGFLFFAAITGYNFVKYASKAALHHRSLTSHLKSIQVFSFVCFLFLLYFIFLQSLKFIVITAILGLFTFLYIFPFLPQHKSLRKLKSLKIFIIAFVWMGATLWLPLLNRHPLFTIDIALKSISYFVFITALILPFEIRDLKVDPTELRTLPQRFGIAKTKLIGYGFLLVFSVFYALSLSTTHAIAINLIIAAITVIFIKFSKPTQSEYYASFWVEAIPIYWFLLLYLI